MSIYDDIDADVLRNYQEFALVNILYLAMKESTTSEQSARMTSMDNASKNACKDVLQMFPDSNFFFKSHMLMLLLVNILNSFSCRGHHI